MKQTIYILLLLIGMTTIVPVMSLTSESVAAVYAADAKAKAKAQREKEKAKKLKEREKAKAQAQKAREKAAAQKKKEQEKRKKEAAKAKAKQANASSKPAAKPAAKSAKTAKSQPELSAAEEKAQYLAQIAAIEKNNKRVMAYQNRDIDHRLGFWGQVGYSNLFTSGISFNPGTPNPVGFLNKDKGFVGGGAGLGYQMRYKQFLMTVGAEFNTYNTNMAVSNQPDGTMLLSYGMNPYPNTMTYTYAFQNVNDRIVGGFVQVPVLLGMELKKVPLFWQAGVKVGMGIMGTSSLSGRFTTTIEDKELILDLTEMYAHALVNDAELSRPSTNVKFGLNLAASAEIGVNLDQWIQALPKLRVSLFADYGVLNSITRRPADGAQDIPMQMAVTPNPLDFPVNSALMTTSVANANVNPFLAGVKVAVWFSLPRKQVVESPLPLKPQPRLGIYAYDADSQLALGGVTVEVTDSAKLKKTKNTNKQGQVKVGRVAEGDYRVSASKNGYYPAEAVTHRVEEFTYDTVRIALKRIPAPVVYTLCMNIYDGETKDPVAANVRLTTVQDTTSLYVAQAADDGFVETPLTKGNYIAHLTAAGYMPKEDTILFERDTIDLFIQAIKEGIKVKIENLFFATNKTYILPQSEAAMADLARFMQENEGVTIHIVGHTDAVGSDEANQILSEGRANAVRNNLIERGVAPERITAEGKGEKEPIADNDTEEGRQLNRRVEFVITGTNGADIQQIY